MDQFERFDRVVGPLPTRILRVLFAAVLLAALAAVAAAQVPPDPAARVRVTVPATSGPWPARFLLGVPDTVELDLAGPSPLSVLHPTTGAALPTQLELGLRRPDGWPRSVWASAVMPAGLTAGTQVELQVVEQPSAQSGPALTPTVAWALFHGGPWCLTVEGLAGGVWRSALSGQVQVVRYGPVEVLWRRTSALLEVVPEAEADLRLPHVGVCTIDVRVWAGVDAIDVRVLWEGGVVDSPDAWVIFEEASFRAPWGADVRPLMPTVGVGQLEHAPAGSLLPLAAREAGPHGALPHHRKLWSLGAAPQGKWADVEPVLAGGGWGWAYDGAWAPTAAAATALDLPLPDLGFWNQGQIGAQAQAELVAWRAGRAAGGPLEGSYGKTSWRHPAGIGYGGGTGGAGIDPWPFVDLTWGDPAATFALLYGRLESRLDRNRTALVTQAGPAWEPSSAALPFNFAIAGEAFYEPGHNKNWPSYGQDLGFRAAHPVYRAATEDQAAEALVGDWAYGSDDLQHAIRGRREQNALLELYAEPMARFLVERDAVALRADFFEGGAKPSPWTSTLLWLAGQDGLGSDYGRDLAWATWHVALAYAAGSDAERAALAPWCATALDVLTGTLASNGSFQVIQSGKEREAAEAAANQAGLNSPPFYPAQGYQQSLVALAAAQLRGSFVPPAAREGIDASIRSMAEGLALLGWGPTQAAPDYRYSVVRVVGGKPQPLTTRAQVEACYTSLLHPLAGGDGTTVDGYHTPAMLAAGVLVGAGGEFPAALGRYLGGGETDLLTAARAGAAQAPAVWLPLVAVLEASK